MNRCTQLDEVLHEDAMKLNMYLDNLYNPI